MNTFIVFFPGFVSLAIIAAMILMERHRHRKPF